MYVRSRRLRTLDYRMLLRLSVMLVPLIAGGVVGIVTQQHQIRESRANAQRVGTTFLSLEAAHRALHAGEVAATARVQAPTDPATDRALRAAEARVERALGRLEQLIPAPQLGPVRRARARWGRADVLARTARTAPAASSAPCTASSSPARASSRR